MIFFDGISEPLLRTYLGERLAQATTASFALRRVRLARVDLGARELLQVQRCRVLLGRLDADTLAAPGSPAESAHTAALLDMALSGRLEIRSAPLLSWDPDFAVIGRGVPEMDVLLFGSIRFAPPMSRGSVDEITLACAVQHPAAVRAANARFDEIWERAHDTLEAVTDALCRSRSLLDG